MKSVIYNFNKKLVHISLFVFCITFVNSGNAQTSGKSTNITTVNGKKYYLHKVGHAQSLYGIAKIYNIDVNTILKENPSANKGIVVGQDLKIPFDGSNITQTTKPVEEAKPVVVEESKKEEQPVVNSSNGAEPDLLSMVDDGAKKEKEFVPSTFKSTRNINFHTSEILGKRCLDFRISHRFGPLNSGANNAWGIDGPANLMLSLEYSHTGRWMVGVSRCIENKTAEAFFKWKIIRQVKHGFPFTITYFGGVYHTFQKDPYLGEPIKFYNNVADRVSYVNELIIACKVTPWLSLQVAPAYVHYNLAGSANGLSKNDCVALTGIIRAKYNKRQAIIFEYAYRLNTDYAATGTKYYNSMGIGWEIETGGHVFQLFATNSFGIMENSYLMTTNTTWKASGVRIGFNITRVFALSKKSGE
jgi:LysM repeat protein